MACARLDVTAPLQIMQSRGGLAGTSVARKRPVRLFLSGPAAGVIGGAIVGRSSGHRELITIDVGGTSSDIALVEGGEPVIRAQGNIAGFPVRVPMVDVNAIGAGGGSIAWLDGAGGLRVGPHSAGSDPGPRLLRPWRRGGDRHRCIRRARLARSRLFRRRLGCPRPIAGARRDRTSHRAAAWTFGGRRGARHPSRGECADGRGHSAGLDPPRPRSAPLHAWWRWAAPDRSTRPRLRPSSAYGTC